MKMAYVLGVAVLAATAFGLAGRGRRQSAPLELAADHEQTAAGAPGAPGAPGASEALPPGHPMVGMNGEQPINGHIELGQGPGVPALRPNPDAPLDGEEAVSAAHADTPSSSPIVVPKLEPAKGPNAHVIAELFSEKDSLVGKRVRLRGMVTKITVGVLGQNFLHVRDGSGQAADKTDDLAVTTKAQPARGDVVIFEGVLRLDADLGIGYRYPALLENATVVED